MLTSCSEVECLRWCVASATSRSGVGGNSVTGWSKALVCLQSLEVPADNVEMDRVKRAAAVPFCGSLRVDRNAGSQQRAAGARDAGTAVNRQVRRAADVRPSKGPMLPAWSVSDRPEAARTNIDRAWARDQSQSRRPSGRLKTLVWSAVALRGVKQAARRSKAQKEDAAGLRTLCGSLLYTVPPPFPSRTAGPRC